MAERYVVIPIFVPHEGCPFDCIFCNQNGVRTIELGVQSLDEGVLKASGRGHSAEDVYRASALILEKGFRLGLQTMVGLPEDTREKDVYTAGKDINLKPAFVRIYPVLVIRGTYLEKLLLGGSYIPPSLEEAVGICAELLETYEAAGIKVIRMGRQSSRGISEGSEVVAGRCIQPSNRN